MYKIAFQTYLFLKKKISLWNLCLLLFFANFFLGSCSIFSTTQSNYNGLEKANIHVEKKDQAWMEEFFQEFFLGGSTIYTLFGSKPISGKIISYASEEDCKKSALLFAETEGLQEKEKIQLLSEASKSCREDDFSEKWEKWLSFFNQYPNSPFLFAKHPTKSQNLWVGHILNVQETVWILQKNYEIFKKELNLDFDPVEVTLSFTDEKSLFWKRVFSNHLLTGIVYGYGYKNSFFFDRLMKQSIDERRNNPLFFSIDIPLSQKKIVYSINSIPLPTFRSFRLPFSSDPIIEKYESEREQIQLQLTEENFFEKILLQLTGRLQ